MPSTGENPSHQKHDVFGSRDHHSLYFDAGRLTGGKKRKVTEEFPVVPGHNLSSEWRGSGTAGAENRKTKSLTEDLMKVLAKQNKNYLWEKFLSSNLELKLKIASELQKVYRNPDEASKDNFKKAISLLELMLENRRSAEASA